jgi:hypothetical protein
MKLPLSWLRLLLLLDAVVLALLGVVLIAAPIQVLGAFQFKNLPVGVSYLVGLWGCVVLTLSLGYVVAASNPIRHLVWVQVGIARGLLEFALGLVFVARGVVTFSQAGLGIVLAGAVALAYALLYPRHPRLAVSATATGKPEKAP